MVEQGSIGKEYEKQKNQSIDNFQKALSQLNIASQDATAAAADNPPTFNSEWIQRQKQANRLTALNSMFTLIGQGIAASAGVRPGRAPQVSDPQETMRQIEQAYQDYRHDKREYAQGKLKEAISRQKTMENLASDMLSSADKTMQTQSRERIAQENIEHKNQNQQQKIDASINLQEQKIEGSKELQAQRDRSAKDLLSQKQQYDREKEERKRTQPSEPLLYVTSADGERVPLYGNDLSQLYEEAAKRNLLGSYQRAKNESTRSLELSRAIQKAYSEREKGAVLPQQGSFDMYANPFAQ